ncbi:hypothetical protein [Desulforhopalus singaporensis]|uniref:Uncharacterized protein n=1 Tax=Desulforhopalus singaporensis TaxID=91360 RepID=A0A1H0UGU0_9BACT|nr:hypothetical protein [Desulforhopalus singaporensis]SDP65235.1 hypothetical protein SAMN05660330_03537 [Desulforhopalus singaporensis]
MERRKGFVQLEITEKSTADLRGRQSVRTTFKLSERSISALSVLASQLGIKQKSLFDHLIEDTRALALIAEGFETFDERSHRVPKTFVISRKTLENLENVSMQYDTPRDALVEYSIERILPLIEKEKKKHEKRKILYKELREYLDHGLAMLNWSEQELGEEDPAFHDLLSMMKGVTNCVERVGEHVRKGRKIEDF